MPMINVQMLKGRPAEAKRALAQALTDAMVTHCKVAADQVWVVIEEVDRENWATGGQLFADRS